MNVNVDASFYNVGRLGRAARGFTSTPIMQPYPSHLVQRARLRDGSPVTLRPIRPEDEGIEQEFVRNLSDESRYFRFRDAVRELSPRMLSQLTCVDYDRHLALIAVTEHDGRELQVGVARYVASDDGRNCEFAIAIADDWQRKGLGSRLMSALMAAARERGVREMYGEVLAGNQKMLEFTARLGFRARLDAADPSVVRVERTLA
jgi:acetyltransferase